MAHFKTAACLNCSAAVACIQQAKHHATQRLVVRLPTVGEIMAPLGGSMVRNGQKARWIYCINMNDVFSLRDIFTETLVTDGNCSSDSNTFLLSSTSGTICRVFSFQVGYFTVQFIISEATVTPSAWKQHGDGLGKLGFFLWKIISFAILIG